MAPRVWEFWLRCSAVHCQLRWCFVHLDAAQAEALVPMLSCPLCQAPLDLAARHAEVA